MSSETGKDGQGFLTAAAVGLDDSGDQRVDVTGQLKALAAMARQRSFPVRLGARTYLTNGETIFFSTSVSGAGPASTVIRSTAAVEAGPVIAMSGPATIENLSIDGNVSPDPPRWTASNYDRYTGSEGLLVDADGVTVRKVGVRNVRRAGFKVAFRRKKVLFEDCTADRCRGNFGDGFIAMAAEGVVYRNCRARDFTRIGFVADTYLDAPRAFCSAIRYEHCVAEDGHDGSILFGGTEYNAGWWGEQSDDVSCLDCHARRVTHRGFTGTAGDNLVALRKPAEYRYAKCTVSDCDSGFVIVGLGGVPVKAILDECVAEVHGSVAFHIADAEGDDVQLVNCRSRLAGANPSRVSLRVGPGTATVDRFGETWVTLDAKLRDDPMKYYGSVGHFNNAPGRLTVRDWSTFDARGNELGTVYKFQWSAENSLDLRIEGGLVRGVLTVCRNFTAIDVDFERICNLRVGQRVVIRGGTIHGALKETPAFLVMKSTKEILVEDVMVNLDDDGGYLYFYNLTSDDPITKIHLKKSAFRKNYQRDGYVIRINGDLPFLQLDDCNNISVTDCVFTNTGTDTKNSIFHFDGPRGNAGSIVGKGNWKSHSLPNIASNMSGTLAGFGNWD